MLLLHAAPSRSIIAFPHIADHAQGLAVLLGAMGFATGIMDSNKKSVFPQQHAGEIQNRKVSQSSQRTNKRQKSSVDEGLR
jgi:hypothetical protein